MLIPWYANILCYHRGYMCRVCSDPHGSFGYIRDQKGSKVRIVRRVTQPGLES